jgi:hypothetical protein
MPAVPTKPTPKPTPKPPTTTENPVGREGEGGVAYTRFFKPR